MRLKSGHQINQHVRPRKCRNGRHSVAPSVSWDWDPINVVVPIAPFEHLVGIVNRKSERDRKKQRNSKIEVKFKFDPWNARQGADVEAKKINRQRKNGND